jgi:anti-sigma-K factor RskA
MARLHPIAVVGVGALALLVAAAVKRAPADFAALPVMVTIRDTVQRPLWEIRVARAAHQIAVDRLEAGTPPEGRAFRLWLAAPEGPHSLGLLPAAGRKVIAEIPALITRLAGAGEVIVTLEGARGADTPRPDGPIVFRAAFGGAG